MHPLGLNQKVTFHLQTSTTTTAIATTSTTQTIVKGGLSSVIPNFLGETETKSIAERTVTNAAQSCSVPKSGKKKKKPMTSTQQAEAINQLGAPFALSRISPPVVVQKTSLFSEPCFSKLDAAEKMLLKDLLDQSYLCQNMNLFEVFITDFWTQQEALISLVEAYDKEKLMDELSRFLNCHHIVLQIHNLYLYTYGKEKNDLGIPAFGFHADFFQSVPGMGVWLASYSKNLNLLITKIDSLQATRRQGKFKSVIALYEQKFMPLHACLQLLDRKSQLLAKCLKKEGMDKLFVTKKISAWSESCKSDDATQQFATLTKFTTFIKYFSRMGAKDNVPAPGSINEKILSYIHIIEEMIASKFSKKTVAKFILAYKDYSYLFLQSRLLMVDHIKSVQKDPSFSHKQTFNTSNEGLLIEDMESLHTATLINMVVIDKWMNDLHHIISGHFLVELREIHVIEPHAYIKRLLMMFELAKNYQFEERLPDPSLEPINDLMKKLTTASDLQFKSIFASVSFSEIASKLQSNFLAEPFHLSGCLFALSPIADILKDGVKVFQLDQLRHEILQGVLVAKQNHQLDHWEPQKLKEAIQELIFQRCFPLCIFMMIIADTEALTSKNHPNDVLHLLPNDVVRLLDLSGFDDIFPKTSSVASVEEAVAVDSNLALQEENEQLQEPTDIKTNQPSIATSKKKSQLVVPKPIIIPEKEDFQNTMKRRVIVRMLERMNFLFERTGRHDVYRNSVTSGIVVVPHNLDALGTRMSVFNQALAALPRQEGKAD